MVPTMPLEPQPSSPVSSQVNVHLSARDLSVWRGGRLIFKGLDIELKTGDSVVVTGPNGSGKSTLLRILAGLLRPETGTVSISPGAAANIRYSGHKEGLKSALTVRENLIFWAAMYSVPETETEKALDRLDLHKVADMPTDILSAGWKRRVGLARMLLGEAPLWILDEPYTSLDSENIARLDTVLTERTVAGGIIVLATHQNTGFTPTHRINMSDYQALTVQMREDSW